MIIHFNSKYIKEKFQIYIAKSMENVIMQKCVCIYINVIVQMCLYVCINIYWRMHTHTHTETIMVAQRRNEEVR